MNIVLTKEMPRELAKHYPEGSELIKIGRMDIGMALKGEYRSQFTLFTGFCSTPWYPCNTDNLEGAIECRVEDLFKHVGKIRNEMQMEKQ